MKVEIVVVRSHVSPNHITSQTTNDSVLVSYPYLVRCDSVLQVRSDDLLHRCSLGAIEERSAYRKGDEADEWRMMESQETVIVEPLLYIFSQHRYCVLDEHRC